MQLHEVDVIKEMFSVRDVNQSLSEGWRIVAVVSAVDVGEHPVACYVLGRKLEPKPPQGEYVDGIWKPAASE